MARVTYSGVSSTEVVQCGTPSSPTLTAPCAGFSYDHCAGHLKLWIFATVTPESEMVKFTDEGDSWVPDSVVATGWSRVIRLPWNDLIP